MSDEALRVLRPGQHRGPAGPDVVAELAARPLPPGHRTATARSSPSSSTSASPARCRGSADPKPPGCSTTFRDPDRGFDAVVIGEPQRAFYGNQFGLTFPVFTHYGVELWVPEVGGAVDPGSEAHDLVMSLYGGMSKGERMRIKTRVRSAMASPGRDRGPLPRRPPALRLPARRRRPAPEPGQGRRSASGSTSSRPTRPPRRSCSGSSTSTPTATASTASPPGLNRDGIPSPVRPRPRPQPRTAPAGRASGPSPRSGRSSPTPATPASRSGTSNARTRSSSTSTTSPSATSPSMRWNDQRRVDLVRTSPPTSRSSADELFDAAQAMFGGSKRADHPDTDRTAGTTCSPGCMRCGVCGRRMQGHWNHGRAYYRCKFTDDYPGGDLDHPKNIYVQEDAVVPGLDAWLATLFDDDHLDDTCERLAGVSEPDPDDASEREAALRAAIADCDRKLANYRAAARRTRTPSPSPPRGSPRPSANARTLERQLGQHVTGDQLTPERGQGPRRTHSRTSSTCSPSADPQRQGRALRPARHLTDLRPRREPSPSRLVPVGYTVRVGGGT